MIVVLVSTGKSELPLINKSKLMFGTVVKDKKKCLALFIVKITFEHIMFCIFYVISAVAGGALYYIYSEQICMETATGMPKPS